MAIYVPHSKIVIAGLSYVQPVVDVSYLQIKVTAEVSMPDVLSVDVVTPADDAVLAFSKTLTDSEVLVDALAKSSSKPVSDSASIAEDIHRIRTYKGLSDTQSLTEDLTYGVSKRLIDVYSGLVDDTALSTSKVLAEVYSGLIDDTALSTSKGLADVFSMVDTVDIEYWLDKTIADTQAVVEQFAYAISKPFIDSTSAATDALTAINTSKGVEDSFGLFDMVDLEYAFTKILAEMLFPAELYASSVDKPLADGQAISDSIASLFSKPLADSTNAPTDALTAINTSKGLSDINAPTDAITAIDAAKGLSDNQVISEAIAYAYSKPFADNNSPLDSMALGFSPAYTDTQSMADASNFTYLANFTDSVAFTDSTEAVRLYLRDVFDGITSVDSYSGSFTQAPNSDTASTNDVYTSATGKSLFDSSVLIDNMDGDIQYTFVKLVGELLSSADSSLLAFSASKADNVVNSDSGMLIMQDYADITYFLEDYVGTSRTF